jgi:5-hydroxyisourate hydrolase
MSRITTHVLDTSRGKPASGVPVVLAHAVNGAFVEVARAETNADGRAAELIKAGTLVVGTWRIRFDTAAYFRATEQRGFYPYVEIVFDVIDAEQHHHVPLLLNPYGYTTYRGS